MKNNNLTVKDFEDNGYFADQELVDVVNASLFLKKPILIEGPAGTGKTYLAKTLAKIFETQLIRLQCHEGIDEDKALYEWNYKKQLISIQTEKDSKNLFTEEFLIERPILQALKSENKSIFLVDEIDRSDEEFEALLLEVLAENQVSIPELGTITSKNENLTVLTSNATRELSEALRRRCLYFYLDYPSVDIETKVILNNVESIDEEKARKFSMFSNFVRSLGLNKPPSLIESVEWVKYNHLKNEDSLDSNIGILIKDIEDQKVYLEKIKEDNANKNQ
ncbi:MAG: AAA family ATPase [Candidatus Actinomarina sp.]|jgi:MoxR-like ATPase|tara:strand:- start:223 stop:1056 length:834 start_codon:yes stop_codon:yes gene_type:complete